MRIQYISDIHLEFYENSFPKLVPIAPILCLCGDIGTPEKENYTQFLEWTSNNYKHVFIITGNHEYYSKTSYDDINNMIENIVKKYYNITFLNRGVKKLDNYTFIGCTLWSELPKNISYYQIKEYNDFRKIRGLRPDIYNSLYKKDYEFLEKCIEKYDNIICLTHHLPSPKLIHDKYKNLPYFMFASNLEHLIKSNVKLWLCGHSHLGNTVLINDTLCSLNPFGYPGENTEEYVKDSLQKFIENI